MLVIESRLFPTHRRGAAVAFPGANARIAGHAGTENKNLAFRQSGGDTFAVAQSSQRENLAYNRGGTS